MFVIRRRVTPALRRFITSDDDLVYNNDRIKSTHQPKANTPFRILMRTLTRIGFYGGTCLFAYTMYTYKYEKDPQAQPLIFEPVLHAAQSVDESVRGLYSLFVDPPMDKLLPDMPRPPPGYALPKTLVLDLRGTLVFAEYVFGDGYTIMKRPGLTEFLNKVSQMYEVVVFSDDDIQFTFQLSESLDPKHRIFSGRLGRESLCLRGSEHVKDLSYLNRDLRNVIIIDKNPTRVRSQPDNAILLQEFKGDQSDRELLDLLPFLEHIAKNRVPDVRQELEKYGHSETGKNFKKELEKRRDGMMRKSQSGLFGMLNKPKPAAAPGPLEEGTPKPPPK